MTEGSAEKHLRTTLAPPTPELLVEDVERAQQHYRDALGFEIGWTDDTPPFDQL